MITINRIPKSVFLLLWSIIFVRLWFPIIVTLPPGTSAEIGLANLAQSIQKSVQIAKPVVDITRENVWLPTLFTTIWIVVVILLLLAFFALYIFHVLYFNDAIPFKDNTQISEFIQKQKMHRNVIVFHSDKVDSPISYGVFKPRILLPSSIDLSDTETLQFILLHEIFHIKRFDVIWKAAINCTACIYWFNPAIWVYLFCVNRDLETSCDEYVLYRSGIQSRAQYANALVKMSQSKTNLKSGFSGFSINSLSERIVAVMHFKKTSIWAVAMCLAVTLISITAFANAPHMMDFPVSSISQYCSPGSILIVGADKNLYMENSGIPGNVSSDTTNYQETNVSSSPANARTDATDSVTHMPNRESGMRYIYDGGKALIKITNQDNSLYYFPADKDTPAEYKGGTWFVIDPAVNPSQKGVAFNIDTSEGMYQASSWVTRYVQPNKQKGIITSLKAQQGSKCMIYYEWAVTQ